jgi:TPR repeat protein
LLVSIGTGCGPGAAAEAIRPGDPTAAGALGEGSCHDPETFGEPLVVDWKPEQRGDLEVAMKEGVAVVSYSCKGIKLLKDCHIDGKYGFIGMTKKEQMVRLQNADEVRANLPLGGMGIAGQIGAEMSRGATIDIALVMVGKTRTTWALPTSDDLKGSCDGATHFVRGATVGAFAMDTGTKAKARAVAELFGASLGGGSSSAKKVHNKEGDISDCGKATPDSEKAPAQCGAPLRLVLAAVTKAKEASAAKPGEKPATKPLEEGPKVEAAEEGCPKGLVFADGKCTTPASTPAYQCDAENSQDCTRQCDSGHAGSCGALGALYASGRGVSRDPKRAIELLKKGCDGGDSRSCVNLGMLTAEGIGAAKDPGGAAKLFEKGCKDGDAKGCSALGKAYLAGAGVASDPGKAASLMRQGCEGGDDSGCAGAARLYADGKGVTKDAAKAVEFMKRACDGTEAASCNELGEMYESGTAGRQDKVYAEMLYRRGCFRNSAMACVNLGRLQMAGPQASSGEPKRHFESACNFHNVALACAYLKILYSDPRPVFPDVAATQGAQQRCNAGSNRDCGVVGAFHLAQGLKPMAQGELDRACRGGDKFACELAKKAR